MKAPLSNEELNSVMKELFHDSWQPNEYTEMIAILVKDAVERYHNIRGEYDPT